MDSINSAPNTEKMYLQAMQFFSEWAGKTPNELLIEAESEIKNGILCEGRVPELLTNSEKRVLPLHLRKTQRDSCACCFQYLGTRPDIENNNI
jgi:hypothetical protein